MRWVLFAMSVAIAASFWLPGEAAQPVPAAANADKITFPQYRDWRNAFIERRRSELSMQLSVADLPAARKARLQPVKAYYDWLAGLAEADRDRRFRERFDRIDSDHDGTIDAAERTTWRDEQRAFYRRSAAASRTPAGASAEPDEAAAALATQ
jgi:hypothetical protein